MTEPAERYGQHTNVCLALGKTCDSGHLGDPWYRLPSRPEGEGATGPRRRRTYGLPKAAACRVRDDWKGLGCFTRNTDATLPDGGEPINSVLSLWRNSVTLEESRENAGLRQFPPYPPLKIPTQTRATVARRPARAGSDRPPPASHARGRPAAGLSAHYVGASLTIARPSNTPRTSQALPSVRRGMRTAIWPSTIPRTRYNTRNRKEPAVQTALFKCFASGDAWAHYPTLAELFPP